MTEPLRLFIVGINWPPETFIARKLRGLADSGLHVTVCAAQVDGPADHPNIDVLPLTQYGDRTLIGLALAGRYLLRGLLHPRHLLRAWRLVNDHAHDVRQALRELQYILPYVGRQPDVVHFEWNKTAIHLLPFYALFAAPVTVSCRGSQVQIAPHVPGDGQADLVQGLRESFAAVAGVHCVSEAIKVEAVRYGANPADVRVIRPAVDPAFFCPPESPPPPAEALRIITTGGIHWRKGYDYLLMALRRLLDCGVPAHLTIIGGGPELQRLYFTIDDLDLNEQVTVAGLLTPAQVRDRLQASDVFVLASLSEGISNAVLEGMSCGLPAVTTDCGGMREAVTDGVQGLVVPVRDAVAMSDALARLARDPGLRAEMGAAARARIVADFTLAQQVADFVTMYREVAAAGQSAGQRATLTARASSSR